MTIVSTSTDSYNTPLSNQSIKPVQYTCIKQTRLVCLFAIWRLIPFFIDAIDFIQRQIKIINDSNY